MVIPESMQLSGDGGVGLGPDIPNGGMMRCISLVKCVVMCTDARVCPVTEITFIPAPRARHGVFVGGVALVPSCCSKSPFEFFGVDVTVLGLVLEFFEKT